MILVRPGGVLGLVIALMVAALLLFVVRPAIDDTTQRAFDTADRMLDETSSQLDAIGAGDDPAAVIAAVRRELGPRAQLLDITFTGKSGSVKYRSGDGASGYQWGPGHHGLEPVNVTLIGAGRLADNLFPIAELEAGAPARLAAAATSKGVAVQSIVLAIEPATGKPRWTVTGQAGGRTRVYTANSAATRLKPGG